ncbi:hypothetical protein, partial [Shewanella algicola]|uniref:hypothetical protein n=1 Tax=Shewanella algicola TaxID=640633 RepID=UPI002494EBD3
TVSPGTEAAAGSLSIAIGDNSSNITLQADMTAEDVQDKINSLDGVSDVVVTQATATAATQSTMDISGISVNTGETLSLTLGGESVTLLSTDDAAAQLTKFQTAATSGGFTVSESGGTFTFTGPSDGSQFTASVDYSGTETVATTATINGNSTAGDGSNQ